MVHCLLPPISPTLAVVATSRSCYVWHLDVFFALFQVSNTCLTYSYIKVSLCDFCLFQWLDPDTIMEHDLGLYLLILQHIIVILHRILRTCISKNIFSFFLIIHLLQLDTSLCLITVSSVPCTETGILPQNQINACAMND